MENNLKDLFVISMTKIDVAKAIEEGLSLPSVVLTTASGAELAGRLMFIDNASREAFKMEYDNVLYEWMGGVIKESIPKGIILGGVAALTGFIGGLLIKRGLDNRAKKKELKAKKGI